jgi:hypothetical protein
MTKATSPEFLDEHTPAEWHTYSTPGGVVDVPPGWSMDPPSANNDLRGFTSPDGKAELMIWGYRLGDLPGDEEVNSELREVAKPTVCPPAGCGQVTYSKIGSD